MNLEKIDSFKVDHTILKRGVHVSRADTFNDTTLVTYDLRFLEPNTGLLDSKGVHTLEHFLATYLRNSKIADKIVYVGPMGCRTGFYCIVEAPSSKSDFISLLIEISELILKNKEIPGLSKEECGSFEHHSLTEAHKMLFDYLEVLKKIA